jgi:hypothetical protein
VKIEFGRLSTAALLLGILAGTAAIAGHGQAQGLQTRELAVGDAEQHFETFLDRLMRAESAGRDFAANPRSTALGPFQFIKATFIDVARRHFAEVAALGDEAILALRTDRSTARRAAAIYSMENLAYLAGRGLQPSYGDLRLAYLVGPVGAARLLQASPDTPARDILGASAIRANPFMAGMSASALIARAARDIGEHRAYVAEAPEPRERPVALAPRAEPRPAPVAPALTVRCNQKLVACQRWIAMQTNKQRVAQQRTSRQAAASRKASSRDSRRNRPGV